MPHVRAIWSALSYSDNDAVNWLMENHDNEEWFSLYEAALVESEDSKLPALIGAARQAILARIESMHALSGHHPKELHALRDALNLLEQESH